MEKVRVGLIGLGMISKKVHIPGLLQCKNAEITAVCDSNIDNLQQVGNELNIPETKRFNDYKELISCTEVDAIDISTPNYTHYDIGVYASRYKKSICLEKPVTINYRQAVDLEKAVKIAGIKSTVCFSYRYLSSVRYAKTIIDMGLIGDVINIYISYKKSTGLIKNRKLEWRFQKSLSGAGVLADLGSHMIDIVCFLVGNIKELVAQTSIIIKTREKENSFEKSEVTTDDTCDVLFKMHQGANGVISMTRCAVDSDDDNIEVNIYGQKGMVGFKLRNKDELLISSGNIDFETNTSHWVKVPKEYETEQMSVFIDNVLGHRDKYMADISDGVRAQRYIEAMIKSDEEKRWIEL